MSIIDFEPKYLNPNELWADWLTMPERLEYIRRKLLPLIWEREKLPNWHKNPDEILEIWKQRIKSRKKN